MTAVILNAGKSTRLDGRNKLFVKAGGVPVHKWHERTFANHNVALVGRSNSLLDSAAAMPWIRRFVAHDEQDGPVGALKAYLDTYHDDTNIVVAYADTLIAPQVIPIGDWVGVAPVIYRTWDHRQPDGSWAKVVPSLRVGIGLYSFTHLEWLRECIATLGAKDDQHLPVLLNLYERKRPMADHEFIGWHDAGDPAAIARVPDYDASDHR